MFSSYPTDATNSSLPKYILLSVPEGPESQKSIMDAHPEPRTVDPHTGQPSSTQRPVPWPKYFVSRPDGTKSPLIAADELPCNMSIVGLPTTISTEQTFGMMHVGVGEREPYPASAYTLEIAGSSLQHSKNKPLRANTTETKPEELITKDDDLRPQEKHNLNVAQAAIDSVRLVIVKGDKNGVTKRTPNYKNPCKYWSANGSCPFGKKCFWKHEKPAEMAWRASETNTAHGTYETNPFFQPEQIFPAVEASSVRHSPSISVVPPSENVGFVTAVSVTSATAPMAIEKVAAASKPERITSTLSTSNKPVSESVSAANNLPSFTVSAISRTTPMEPEQMTPASELGKPTLSLGRYSWPKPEPQSLLDQCDLDDIISISPIPTLIPTKSRPHQTVISLNVQAKAMPLEIEAQSIVPYPGDESGDLYLEVEEEPEKFVGAEDAMTQTLDQRLHITGTT